MAFDVQTPETLPPVATDPPAWDLSVGLINATVQLDQPTGDGTRTVGTGFLIDAPAPDGSPRTVLVTAGHVLERMPGKQARVGWRVAMPDGSWRFDPQPLDIRGGDDQPLWTRHPQRDIAVMKIEAPEAFARAAIPMGWLADSQTLADYEVGPGDEMLSLGFPRGLSANRAGFPILRVGRVASWPLFWTDRARRRPGSTGEPDHPFVAGVLTQEVMVRDERLELGVVAHAEYIREAIAELDAADAVSP